MALMCEENVGNISLREFKLNISSLAQEVQSTFIQIKTAHTQKLNQQLILTTVECVPKLPAASTINLTFH